MEPTTLPSPVAPPVAGAPSSRPRQSKTLYIVVGVVFLLIVLLVATFFSSYLTTKVAPGKKFKVLGPNTLTAGQVATLTWDASPENVKQYPSEKIEYCTGKLLKQKCYLLAAAVPNNGKAQVKVPTSLPVGKGVLKFTARDPNRKILGTTSSVSGAVTVKPAQTASASEESGGGGGSGGGSGGGGGGSSGGGSKNVSQPAELTPTPTSTAPASGAPSAEFIVPVDDEEFAVGEPLDARVKLTETDSSKILCQEWLLDGVPIPNAAWEGGQSPDLSAAPCQ